MEWVDTVSYDLPTNWNPQTVRGKLLDIMRPCAPDVTAHFVRLHSFKPFFEADQERMDIVFEVLLDDLKDYPEVAVVLGLDDLRKAEGRYWPETFVILNTVQDYTGPIYECVGYFNDNKNILDLPENAT